jgi:hypothetical protein
MLMQSEKNGLRDFGCGNGAFAQVSAANTA